MKKPDVVLAVLYGVNMCLTMWLMGASWAQENFSPPETKSEKDE